MLRAMRLVVDTGLHAQGLDARAGDPLHARQLDAGGVRRRLRSRALHRRGPARRSATRSATCASRACATRRERELGAKFDVRDFHREVLSDGAVPHGRARAQDRALDRRASLSGSSHADSCVGRLRSGARARRVRPVVRTEPARRSGRRQSGRTRARAHRRRLLRALARAQPARGDRAGRPPPRRRVRGLRDPDVDGGFAGSGAGRAGGTARGRSAGGSTPTIA